MKIWYITSGCSIKKFWFHLMPYWPAFILNLV